jgi:GH24 family phage-related lysozyme (muramidase)
MSARRKAAGGIAGSATALALAINFIGGWEGSETTAYWDHFGAVWTVCSGETRGVAQGDTYSQAECDAMLAVGVLDFERQLDACLTNEDSIPVNAKIAFVSWTYNIGAGAACGSTLVRKANAGDLDGACRELPRWNKAGGQVIRGLSNRRGAERRMCLDALEPS